jgi:putative transposase
MAWLPRKLTAEQGEERRRKAAAMLRVGKRSQAQIARELAVAPSTVCEWAMALEQSGLRGLRARPKTGRPSKLLPAQWKELLRILERGPMVAGFPTDRWTLQRIAKVIASRFGAKFHPHYLAEPLHKLGFSPQRPKVRARERDDALVEAWLKRDWPRIKRGLDEAGQRLPSWTRRVVRFGPASAPPGRESATRPCGGGRRSGAR